MNKNKNIILFLMVVVLLGGVFFYLYNQGVMKNDTEDAKELKESTTQKNENVVNKKEEVKTSKTDTEVKIEDGIVYYYGSECPHCKDVLAYLDENDIYSKVKFTKKEVWHNKQNGEELKSAALKCGLDPSDIGVPFVFDQGKCYIGGPDVIDFFAQKAGIKK